MADGFLLKDYIARAYAIREKDSENNDQIRFPAFSFLVFQGQLRKAHKILNANPREIPEEDVARDLGDLLVQAATLFGSIQANCLSDKTVESLAQSEFGTDIRDLSLEDYLNLIKPKAQELLPAEISERLFLAASNMAHALTHIVDKKGEWGDRICYAIPEREFEMRTAGMLATSFLAAEAVISKYSLNSSVKEIALIGLKGAEEREGKSRAALTEKSIDQVLAGTNAYSGTVYGIAQVVSQIEEFTGGILVVSRTYSEKNELLRRTKPEAIITDDGGIHSHQAIFAKTERIPAVVGTALATRKIKTGDFVYVHAPEASYEGKVYLLARQLEQGKNLSIVGNKAANLAQINGLRASYPDSEDYRMNAFILKTPASYSLTTEAFELFLDTTGLRGKINALLKDKSPKDTYQDIQNLIMHEELPEPIKAAVDFIHSKLRAEKYAVRSSAQLEDLAQASFAGEYKTELNVAPDNLYSAVKNCWAAYFAESPLSMRARMGEIDNYGFALLFNPVIEGKQSGVMFTKDEKGNMSISAAVGSCENVVADRVTPELIIVDEKTRKHGSETLSPNQISELYYAGKAIERLFRRPQDIEWTFDSAGELYILQSRSVTSQ